MSQYSVEFHRIIGLAAIDVDFVKFLQTDTETTVKKFGFKLSKNEIADLKRILPAQTNVNPFVAVGEYICPRKLCPGLIQPGSETMMGRAILDPTFIPQFLNDPVNVANMISVTLTAFEQHTLATLMATVNVAELQKRIENLANAVQATLTVMAKAAGKVA